MHLEPVQLQNSEDVRKQLKEATSGSEIDWTEVESYKELLIAATTYEAAVMAISEDGDNTDIEFAREKKNCFVQLERKAHTIYMK